jgi:hypothetical protein
MPHGILVQVGLLEGTIFGAFVILIGISWESGWMAPSNVLLIHGYSTRSLATYSSLPNLLIGDGMNATSVFLSAFDSLNDDITCDDLAHALEERIGDLENNKGLDLSKTGIIVHSTGAIIARRWMLNRYATGKGKLPSHFISLAGANHGSSLAQLGTMQVVYLYRRLKGGTQVGKEVLQDLDYGSDFLLKLNEEWLDAHAAANAKPLAVRSFSLGGDDHSAPDHQLFWQTHEDGSDGTVRCSSANLNYRMASVNQNDPAPALTVKELKQMAPHVVIPGISHTGNNGIMGGDPANTKRVYGYIKQALEVSTDAQYKTLAQKWAAETAAWSGQNTDQVCSTLVFSLHHPGGREVKDSLILIQDSAPTTFKFEEFLRIRNSIKPHQPIQNDTLPSSVSFYVDHGAFTAHYPHQVSIQIASGCDEISYPAASYTVAANSPAELRPNEFTYVTVVLQREPKGTYEIIPFSDNPDMAKEWPPLPQPKP